MAEYIVVNGERRPLRAERDLAELVGAMGQDPRLVAVEHNGRIVPRAAWAETPLANGDRLEIVRFVQGGSGSDERL